jgi:hypothetical protein
MAKQSKTMATLIAQGGSFNTQDNRLAAAAKKANGVYHVFSTDLGDGKITHRFTILKTCR